MEEFNLETFSVFCAELYCDDVIELMAGQSTINVMNGARYRLSAVTAGLFMFVIILVASPLIAIVPISSLTGVLFMVVIHTFNWECLRLFFVIPITESIGIVLVTALSVTFDLVRRQLFLLIALIPLDMNPLALVTSINFQFDGQVLTSDIAGNWGGIRRRLDCTMQFLAERQAYHCRNPLQY